MKREQWVVASVVALGGAFALVPGCSGKSISSDRGAPGGDLISEPPGRAGNGVGGSSGTTTIPTGGVVAGGTPGTGGASGSGGTGGGPRCQTPDPPIPRDFVPVTLSVGQGGQGGANAWVVAESGASSGGSDDGESGCTPITNGYHCEGVAHVRRSLELEFVFEDGSVLSWNESVSSVAEPRVRLGDVVTVAYTERTVPACPFCGSYYSSSLDVALDNVVIWLGRDGTFDETVDLPVVESLLGAPTRREFGCSTEPFTYYCYNVVRDLYDHVVETSPERFVPYATPTTVTTPRGSFELLWAHTEQAATYIPNCFDGLSPKDARHFALSRLTPP